MTSDQQLPTETSALEAAEARIAGDPTRPRGVAPVAGRGGGITVVEGSSFCVSGDNGDVVPGGAAGLFIQDARLLSRWELRIDGYPVEPLGVLELAPFECLFVGRAPNREGQLDATVVVERRRLIFDGMREDVTLRNFGAEPAGVDLLMLADTDFADLFHVKELREDLPHRVARGSDASELRFWLEETERERAVHVSASGAQARPGSLAYRVLVEPRQSWSATFEVAAPAVAAPRTAPTRPAVALSGPAVRMQSWRSRAPEITVESTVLASALHTSESDLGSLRIRDADNPDDEVVAAGVPWFMALFGRDSLLTSWMTLPFTPSLAFGTLRTLARLQGQGTDPFTEEQPGRILHEVRLGTDRSRALGGQPIYYGSIDATPLFVMVAGRLLHWGVPAEALDELRTAVDRALLWIDEYGDRDGDGFVEYQRSSDRGLANQGWKDSGNSVVFEDGRPARGPIALAEVQGYCHAAFLAGADLFDAWGEAERAVALRQRAARLRARFHEAFWMPDAGTYALALDGAKRQVDAIASNVGHCLWTGIVADAAVGSVVDRMLEPDMFTGFGIRTLSSRSAAFNPISYHNGSVWPHDTVLAAAGMAAVGRRDAATTVLDGLLDALEAFGGRLPELFCGFARTDKASPVPYPTSCSPQAWASATPFEMLRLGVGLRIDVTRGVAEAVPPPPSLGEVHIAALPVGERRWRLDASERTVRLVDRSEPDQDQAPTDERPTGQGESERS